MVREDAMQVWDGRCKETVWRSVGSRGTSPPPAWIPALKSGAFSTTFKCKMSTRRLWYVSVRSWQEPDVTLHQGIWGASRGRRVGIPVRGEQHSRASNRRAVTSLGAGTGTPGGLSGRSPGPSVAGAGGPAPSRPPPSPHCLPPAKPSWKLGE